MRLPIPMTSRPVAIHLDSFAFLTTTVFSFAIYFTI